MFRMLSRRVGLIKNMKKKIVSHSQTFASMSFGPDEDSFGSKVAIPTSPLDGRAAAQASYLTNGMCLLKSQELICAPNCLNGDNVIDGLEFPQRM